jgi:hypothetical protein
VPVQQNSISIVLLTQNRWTATKSFVASFLRNKGFFYFFFFDVMQVLKESPL